MNPIVYAEVSVAFERIEEVETVLPAATFKREQIPFEAAFLAGKAYLAYRRRGGSSRSPLPDFFVGAHAMVAATACSPATRGSTGRTSPASRSSRPTTRDGAAREPRAAPRDRAVH